MTKPIKNKKELMNTLREKDTIESIALAYLINELIPEDRTFSRLFK